VRALRSVCLLLLVALALGGCSQAGAGEAQASAPDVDGCAGSQLRPTPANGAQVHAATLCLLNAQRARAGVVALTENTMLQSAAEAQSLDMATRKFFEHRNPDGVDPAARIVHAGYPPILVGENLAWGELWRSTPAEIVKSWMGSPGHRANILEPRYREIGIGLAYGAPQPQDAPKQAAIYTTTFGAGGR
jgi:uncharacterized protein YkwD